MSKMGTRLMMVLSGGQDSTTALFMGKDQFEEVHSVTFNYGQTHHMELMAAQRVSRLARVKSFHVIDIKNVLESTSPLTSQTELDQYQNYEAMVEEVGNRVEKTFVPMRNMLFAVIAVNRAIAYGCNVIGLGVCASDSGNYPDCTANFINTLEIAVNESLGGSHIKIWAPLLNLKKSTTVKLAHDMPDCWNALAYTHTSYKGEYPPVDMNHANVLRAKSFEEAGLPDPLILSAVSSNLMELPETDNYKGLK